MNRGCFIFFYEGYVGISPTLVNTAKVLSENGYIITIYGTKNDYPPPGELGERVQIFYFRKAARILATLKNKWPEIVPLLELFIYTTQCCLHIFLHKFLQILKTRPKTDIKINIAVDIYGGIAALIAYFLFKQNYLFLSLELHEPEYIFKGASRSLTRLAKLACQKSRGLIIQDEDRFKTFCQYYGCQPERVFYLPNSTLAAPEYETNQKNYFREKFNLSEKEYPHLILQAGMISDAVYSFALAKAFTEIENCALIFHERQLRRETDPDIQALRQINSKNLFLSLAPLPYNEVDKIFTAPTIGLAFYADIGNNFSQISMASGKLPQYLKWGKPILVNDLPSLSQLVEKYQCGIVIKNPADGKEIKTAIEQILSNYTYYSRNAKACFAAEFDFSKKMQPILDYIKTL